MRNGFAVAGLSTAVLASLITVGTAGSASAAPNCSGQQLVEHYLPYGYQVNLCAAQMGASNGARLFEGNALWLGGSTDVRAYVAVGDTCQGMDWGTTTPVSDANHVYPGATVVGSGGYHWVQPGCHPITAVAETESGNWSGWYYSTGD